MKTTRYKLMVVVAAAVLVHAQQAFAQQPTEPAGVVESHARFAKFVRAGHKLQDLMSQVNHPNRKGHDLVVEAVMEWFPK